MNMKWSEIIDTHDIRYFYLVSENKDIFFEFRVEDRDDTEYVVCVSKYMIHNSNLSYSSNIHNFQSTTYAYQQLTSISFLLEGARQYWLYLFDQKCERAKEVFFDSKYPKFQCTVYVETE